MTRSRSALASLLSVCLLLGACGGGDDAETQQPRPESGAASTQAPPSAGGGASEAQADSEGRAPQSQGEQAASTSPPVPAGSKAPAPGVPVSKQGDNSIQLWGREASAAERARAASLLERYLDARVQRRWSGACALLAADLRREQRQIVREESCARALGSFAADAPTATLAREADVEVLSFRVADRHAFVIYRRPDGVFAMALVREDGDWRLFTVSPNELS